MDENQPLVSIGMPVYNGERFIRQALDALLAQDYQNFELVISDNASTDSTQGICAEYAKKDRRVRYYRNDSNLGTIVNFSRAFNLSKGEYFLWASCHDLWEHSYISRCTQVLEGNPSAVLCYASADHIDVEGRRLNLLHCNLDTRGLDLVSRCHVVLWGLQYGNPIYGVIRASALKQAKIFEKAVAQDSILLFELSMLGEFDQIPEILLHIRRTPDFGSWDSYIERCFGMPVRGLKKRWLFWGMLLKYLCVINRHIRKIPAKVFLMFSTLLCILVKYRWIRQGISKRK